MLERTLTRTRAIAGWCGPPCSALPLSPPLPSCIISDSAAAAATAAVFATSAARDCVAHPGAVRFPLRLSWETAAAAALAAAAAAAAVDAFDEDLGAAEDDTARDVEWALGRGEAHRMIDGVVVRV